MNIIAPLMLITLPVSAFAGTETLGSASVEIPNAWQIQRGPDGFTAVSDNNAVLFAARAISIAPEWVALADRVGAERDGLFDALTNRGILSIVEFVLSAGGRVRAIQKEPLSPIEQSQGFVSGAREFSVEWDDGAFIFTTNFTVAVGIDSTHYYEAISGVEFFAQAQDLAALQAISSSLSTSRPFSIADAALGQLVVRVSGGQVSLTLDLESSTTLANWSRVAEFSVSAPVTNSSAEFFRFTLSQ